MSDHFGTDRNRQARIDREYVDHMQDINASFPAQLDVTRGDGVIKARGCWLSLMVAWACTVAPVGMLIWALVA